MATKFSWEAENQPQQFSWEKSAPAKKPQFSWEQPAAPSASPAPAPRAQGAASPAASASKPPSLWSRAVGEVEGIGRGIAEGVRGMPAARRKAGQEIVSDVLRKAGPMPVGERIAGALHLTEFPGAFQRQVGGAAKELAADITKPIDWTKGAVMGPLARAGRVGLDVANLAYSPVSAAATGMLGRDIEAATGINRDVAGNLVFLPGAVEGIKGLTSKLTSAVNAIPRAARAAKETTPLAAPHIRSGINPLHAVTQPEFADPYSRAAAPFIAGVRATHDLSKSQLISRIDPLYRTVGNMPLEAQRDIVRSVQGVKPKTLLTPEQMAAASELKSVLAKAGEDFSRATKTPLRENYFPGEWQQTMKGKGRGFGKVGSGKQAKAKVFSNIDEALKAGFTERYANPLDAVTHYLEDVYTRVSHADTIKGLETSKMAKWAPAAKVPEGYTKLEGPGTIREAKALEKGGLPAGTLPRRVLVAPDSVARLHNNRLAPSLRSGILGPAVKPAMTIGNLAKTSVLGAGSPFHTVLTSVKGFGGELTRGVNELMQGRFYEGAATIAKSPLAPYTLVKRGSDLSKSLLREGPKTEAEKLMIRGGLRVNAPASYERNLRPNLYESARRGTFRTDLKKAFGEIAGPGKNVKERLGATAELMDSAVQSANHFTFKYQVPNLKIGVADAEINSFLKANPGATEAEKIAYARKVLRSVDSRMGEMVKDNNFWHTYYDELSRIALLSPSWVQGNIRLYGDALKDLPASFRGVAKGKGMGVDTSALMGVAASRTLVAGLTTYLLTGEPPKEKMDWVAPRTGGLNRDGSPERLTVPSSMKELDQFLLGEGVGTQAYGKLNPAIQTALELGQNKDYFGRPIMKPSAATIGGGKPSVLEQAGEAAQYALERNAPIGFQNQQGMSPGSRIPEWLRFLGAQPAGQKYAEPEKRAAMDTKYANRAWKAKLRAERKKEAQKK